MSDDERTQVEKLALDDERLIRDFAKESTPVQRMSLPDRLILEVKLKELQNHLHRVTLIHLLFVIVAVAVCTFAVAVLR